MTRTYNSESRVTIEINSSIVLNLNKFFKGGKGEANPEDPADLVVEPEHGRGWEDGSLPRGGVRYSTNYRVL